MAELLSQSRLPQKEQNNARTIARSGQILLEMLNEILDFAKLEQGLATPEAVPFRIRDVVDAAVALMQARAAERDNQLNVDLSNTASTTYLGDPKRVEQVLLNLLSNTIKFTANGKAGVEVHEEMRAEGRWLTVAISDTGIGIPEDARVQLFTPFNQLDASITRRHGPRPRHLQAAHGKSGWNDRGRQHSGTGERVPLLVPCPRRCRATGPGT
ncbi:ATP-binding protein [Breoghania sp.]|uniref:sensor histidine kinase n=1 Tax=Breoghania sp. TaxID=2065378 RepID=UPI00261E29A2|nr:ATP-binding protein [Breoghania sp.]MDJ0933035.1 ATP-binding protein [Breoghania sp.]